MRPVLIVNALAASLCMTGCLHITASIPKGPIVSFSVGGAHATSYTDEGNGISSMQVGNGPEITAAGDQKSEDRNVPTFTGVAVADIISLEYTQGPADSVRVSAQENILKHVKTEVNKDGVLNIELEEGNYHHVGAIIVTVTSPTIKYLDASSSSRAKATGIDTDKLELGCSGGSTMNITGKCGELKGDVSGGATLGGSLLCQRNTTLEVSGSATAELSGPSSESADFQVSGSGRLKYSDLRTNVFSINLTGGSQGDLSGSAKSGKVVAEGAGQANIEDLAIDVCDAEASGASTIRANVTSSLKAEASGASNITYKGSPVVHKSASDASNVSQE